MGSVVLLPSGVLTPFVITLYFFNFSLSLPTVFSLTVKHTLVKYVALAGVAQLVECCPLN